MYPQSWGVDPHIAAALRAHGAQHGVTPLPQVGVDYNHVLGMGGGDRQMQGVMLPQDTPPILPPEILQQALTLFQARKAQSNPAMTRLQAVTQAHQLANQHLSRIQHKRRANGPYG